MFLPLSGDVNGLPPHQIRPARCVQFMTYDPQGRRISNTASGLTTRYRYNGVACAEPGICGASRRFTIA
jgi:hypothetical protein